MAITIDGTEIRDVTIDGQDVREITIDGDVVWPLMIEDFEDLNSWQDAYRGSFSGNATITSNAALATSEGSTQGLRCNGFVEMWSNPSDHDPNVQRGKEVTFWFHPRNLGNSQYHHIIAPQPNTSHPPNNCYRLEFHMGSGARIVKMKGGSREWEATSNAISWSSKTYTCTYIVRNNEIEMTVAGETLTAPASEFVADTMGHGWRASTGDRVDYDWLGFA